MYQSILVDNPVGLLRLVGKEGQLCGVLFERLWSSFQSKFEMIENTRSEVLTNAERQLHEYFSGQRRSFDLPYHLTGTVFQKNVWQSLIQIPYGETRTYKQQAVEINSPGSVRAVGRADGLNPLCIIAPRHRVIGSNGSLTGYAGGIEAKAFLLKLESTSIHRSQGLFGAGPQFEVSLVETAAVPIDL